MTGVDIGRREGLPKGPMAIPNFIVLCISRYLWVSVPFLGHRSKIKTIHPLYTHSPASSLVEVYYVLTFYKKNSSGEQNRNGARDRNKACLPQILFADETISLAFTSVFSPSRLASAELANGEGPFRGWP